MNVGDRVKFSRKFWINVTDGKRFYRENSGRKGTITRIIPLKSGESPYNNIWVEWDDGSRNRWYEIELRVVK